MVLQPTYFHTMGFNSGGDGIALVAIALSVPSLLLNSLGAIKAICCSGDWPPSWRLYCENTICKQSNPTAANKEGHLP